jgi:RNA polymerase sigma factor (sigma-70 family)
MADGEADSDDRGALEHQFRHARAALVTWFRRRIGDAAEAEDLAQECYVRIAGRDGAPIADHFEGYLYQTAKSVLFDRRRRRTVRQADAHVSLLPEHDAADESDTLRSLLARERLRQVSAVLTAMPERTRSIFVLSRLEGMRYAEIAVRFDISVSAVQKHMLRAIEALMQAGEGEA